jgi:hypothetical protein
MLFNVFERRFNIFGFPFGHKISSIFVPFMIVGVVFVILFTVIFWTWMDPSNYISRNGFRRIE